MKENVTVILGAITIAVLIAITIILGIRVDNTPPVIQFEHDIMYEDTQDISVLLDGVTALDRKDGDVTQNIMVESLIVLEGNEFAKVTYTAKDNSNNIAKASRIVGYSGDGKSIYASSTPGKNEPENSGSDIPTENTTEQEETKEIPTEESSEQPETDMTEPESSVESTEQPESTVANREAPVLKMSASSGTIKAGEFFNVASYVESITDDKDSRNELYRRIGIEGSYDSNTVGEYRFKVFCIDSDRNISNKENFVLHVVNE